MVETLKKTYLAGLGLISITYEKAEKLAKDLVKKGEIAREKQQEFINSLVEKAKQNSSQIEKIVKERIEELAEKGKPLKEKQDELVKELSKKAKELGVVSEKNIRKLVSDMVERSKNTKEKIAKTISFDEKVAAVLARLEVPTRRDIDELKKKLNELIRLVKKAGK